MNRRVLVTGSRGFVGRYLLPILREGGWQPVEHDLAQGDLSVTQPQAENIAHVIHLAGRTSVPESWQEPLLHYRANLLGTLNVLEYCRGRHCPLTLVSSYVYGSPLYLPVDENHPVDPAAPYNHSKWLAEEAGRFYAARFGLRLTVIRPFNLYGPGQRGDFLVPTLVRQAIDPASAEIQVADEEPKRDFLYVGDFCAGLAATLDHPSGETFNLGSGSSISVREMARMVMDAAGVRKPLRSRGARRPGEVMDLYADTRKAAELLGWKPGLGLEEGLKRTVAWARETGI